MRTFVISVAIGSLLLILSCDQNTIRPTGFNVLLEENLDPFSSIAISDAFQVEILPIEGQSQIVVSIDENLEPFLILEIENERLVLGISENISIKGSTALKATIYHQVELVSISQSGASTVESFDIIESPQLSIDLSGASTFKAGLRVQNFTADVSGASSLDLRGSVAQANIDLSGASNMLDYAFSIDHLNLDLSGASFSEVTINEELSVEASGASRLYYHGNPTLIDLNVSGGSVILRTD